MCRCIKPVYVVTLRCYVDLRQTEIFRFFRRDSDLVIEGVRVLAAGRSESL